ncbi:MAG: hypothetical protein ND866_28315 [Pyrinomonadaceae bacterium]|nr:hypothetical protein [Pyrinomonadaceae bacterium]
MWLLLLMFLAACPVFLALEKPHSEKTEAQTTQQQTTDTQKKNIEEYIELLGSNVREEKPQRAGTGALVGAGAGSVASTGRGQQIVIPRDTLLEFRLGQPVALPAR